jgi:pimeloyl-ACP methyl ester carboxylesterase
MQLETIVADLEAVRGQLGIDRWVLEGYSGDSQLALTYALRHPDTLAGLIVGFSVANLAGALDDLRSLISLAYPTHQADLESARSVTQPVSTTTRSVVSVTSVIVPAARNLPSQST